MKQEITAVNDIVPPSVPSGGHVEGVGLHIKWQSGPLPLGQNGAFVETVLEAARQRLEFFQTACDRKFACRENALAITKIEEALHWLNHRTERRTVAGIEGTYTPDPK